MKLTNSQIMEQFMFNKYPCLTNWVSFMQTVLPNSMKYDPISCARIALISQAAMKTLDFITQTDTGSNVIRVSKMLADLHQCAWRLWTTFTAQSKLSSGTSSLNISSTVLQGITAFRNWDIVLNPSPTFSPAELLDSVLKGVTV